jgi:streptomycin 6-kinase
MAPEPSMDLPEITQRLARRYGPSVAGWCAGLPALIRAMSQEWALEPGEPFAAGNSSVAIRCTRPGGSPAVLKLSPDFSVVAEQVESLQLFAAGGRVPAVLAANAGTGAVLLELIEPGTTAGELQPPPSAREWASLLSALHKVPVPPGYPHDLRTQCEGFFDRIGRRVAEPEIGRWVTAADVARGAERYEALLATGSARVLLHGDLHLANVLDGGVLSGGVLSGGVLSGGVLDGGALDDGVLDGGALRRLVAIDPRACVGDPCFDAVDYLLDGAGRDGTDGIDARCAALAAASRLDAGRLHDWCRAVAPIVAIIHIRRSESLRRSDSLRRPDWQEAVAELLALASE